MLMHAASLELASPDISVAQQLPSISPCSHLLPVNETSRTDCSHYVHDYLPVIVSQQLLCAAVLHLVGLQLLCITGEPLDQVTRDHVARATGERRVGRTSVLQLLPLPDAIHCPALPETRSGQRIYYHHILSPFHLTLHHFDYPCFFPLNFSCTEVKLRTQVD